MKRRVLAMVLSLAMVFTMLPATTLQAEEDVAVESVEKADAGRIITRSRRLSMTEFWRMGILLPAGTAGMRQNPVIQCR